MAKRRGKPLFLIDIGVPRNIEPEAGRVDSVYLFNIDDLSQVAQANRDALSKALSQAETVLDQEMRELLAWLNNLALVPTITGLRERIESLRSHEWEEFLKKNPDLAPKDLERLERLTRSMAAKMLHEPTVRLKGLEDESDRFLYAKVLRELFGLNPPPGSAS